ncbi:hypothetical protein ABBQ38_005564 [Trebouxia sp. C0009 RCD-2024]
MPVAGPVWTAEEDEMLRRLVAQYGTKKWAHLATIIKTKKSKQEDALLMEGHRKCGNRWTEIAKMVGGRTDNAVKNRWASLTKKNPKLASGSPGSAPSASGDSSFSGSVPSQSRSGQSNQGSLQPTRLPEPNQMSTSNSTLPQHLQGSCATSGSGLTHPRGSLTVRTKVKSEPGSDGTGSARTPGSVSIRVWKESLTPRERRQVQEVNALGLPVTIHLEDQMIPLPPAYVGPPMEGSAGPDSSTLWRSDTDGDLAKWLNSGFSPRAVGSTEEEAQVQTGGQHSPMRSQSFISNQQRQLLHKLFMKGTSQQQVMLDAGQQAMPYAQQTGYPTMLQQSQQYVGQNTFAQQQQQQGMYGGQSTQSMLPAVKCEQQQQQAAYQINAQAYDSVNYAQQQYGGNHMQGQLQQGILTRGQSFALANAQLGMLARGPSFGSGQAGVLTRGQSFALANAQLSGDPGMEGYVESPRLEVLVTPNFTNHELNMLLEALGDDEMVNLQAPIKQEQSSADFMYT